MPAGSSYGEKNSLEKSPNWFDTERSHRQTLTACKIEYLIDRSCSTRNILQSPTLLYFPVTCPSSYSPSEESRTISRASWLLPYLWLQTCHQLVPNTKPVAVAPSAARLPRPTTGAMSPSAGNIGDAIRVLVEDGTARIIRKVLVSCIKAVSLPPTQMRSPCLLYRRT